jgi:hypothetical protein
LNGHPALWNWIFGTGIAYTIIGACLSVVGFLIVATVILIIPWLIVVLCAAGFTFAWMIVGAVSLWRDGGDCISLNFPLWQMGMAAVIISIVLVLSGTGSTKQAQGNDR